jgi:hypothetical protein
MCLCLLGFLRWATSHGDRELVVRLVQLCSSASPKCERAPQLRYILQVR